MYAYETNLYRKKTKRINLNHLFSGSILDKKYFTLRVQQHFDISILLLTQVIIHIILNFVIENILLNTCIKSFQKTPHYFLNLQNGILHRSNTSETIYF